MSDEEIYQKFIDWLGKTWWGLTPSKMLMPLMKARYYSMRFMADRRKGEPLLRTSDIG